MCGFLVTQLNADAHTAQDVKLTIRGVSDSGQTIEINQATTVQSDQTQIVIMRIGELGSGSYTLTAKGNSPIVFDQTAQLTYVHKSYSVFIQTDKAIYREALHTYHSNLICSSAFLDQSGIGHKTLPRLRCGVCVGELTQRATR